ncbi:MAG: carboxypeptidase regulatory-like domain-containing protein [Pirellulales bacterium]
MTTAELRLRHSPLVTLAAALCAALTGCGQSARQAAEMAASCTVPPRGLLVAQAPVTTSSPQQQSNVAPSPKPAAGDVSVRTALVPAAPAEAAPSGVTLRGRVLYKGKPPARRIINMVKDAKCVQLHGSKPVQDEDLIVAADGGIQNAFVRVQRGAPKQDYPMPDKPAVLDQSGCMFHPRVQGIRVGQQLLVKNADPVTHNVRSFPVLNQAFNFGQPPDTEPRVRVFERAEREIEIQCDFHLWMHAYIFVMDHPFYGVSRADGTYEIAGLPPGDYVLEAWHERLGKQRQNVKVAEQDVADVTFTFPR